MMIGALVEGRLVASLFVFRIPYINMVLSIISLFTIFPFSLSATRSRIIARILKKKPA